MEDIAGFCLSVGQRLYGFLFGTRVELSKIHEINSTQSTILAQIQQDVRAGFAGQVQRIDKVEIEIQTLSHRLEVLDNEVEDLRVSLGRLERSHTMNHPV